MMAPLAELTKREWDVVHLLQQGMGNKQIAAALNISERTVEFHLNNIYSKYGVRSRLELILQLDQAATGLKTEKLEVSTVAATAELPNNKAQLRAIGRSWVSSFKEAISIIGKEINMDHLAKEDLNQEEGRMRFQDAIRLCLSKYAEFNGRASRAEFWWFFLFVTLLSTAALYISEAFSGIILIALLLPFLAAGSRRLHDIGKSGWWLLFLLVPVGGLVALVILWASPPATTDKEEGILYEKTV